MCSTAIGTENSNECLSRILGFFVTFMLVFCFSLSILILSRNRTFRSSPLFIVSSSSSRSRSRTRFHEETERPAQCLWHRMTGKENGTQVIRWLSWCRRLLFDTNGTVSSVCTTSRLSTWIGTPCLHECDSCPLILTGSSFFFFITSLSISSHFSTLRTWNWRLSRE